MTNKSIRYVFTVSHAMQYLNALEVRYARRIPKSECAVLFLNKPYDPQIQQLESVLDRNDWGHVEFITYPNYWIPRGDRRNIFKYIKLSWSKIISANTLDRRIREFFNKYCSTPILLCATGNYISRPHRHTLALAENIYGAEELMILDEGTSIPNLIVPIRHDIMTNKMRRFNYRFTWKDFGGLILHILTNIRYHHPERLTFFTIYDEIRPPPSDKVEINHFAFAAEAIKDFRVDEEIWFLGNCYAEHGYASEYLYINLLNRVRHEFPQYKACYFPHRYESAEKLDKIKRLDFSVEYANTNIEARIMSERRYPRAFAAIATSAVDNISAMFNGSIPIHIYKPTPNFFTYEEIIPAVYEIIDGHEKNGRGMVTVHQVDIA